MPDEGATAGTRHHSRVHARASASAADSCAHALDEQHERRLLVGERLHRQADAEEPLRVVNADTSFRAATRTPLGLNERPPSRGTRVRAGPGACKIPASARVEAKLGDELGRLSLRNGATSGHLAQIRFCSCLRERKRSAFLWAWSPGRSGAWLMAAVWGRRARRGVARRGG